MRLVALIGNQSNKSSCIGGHRRLPELQRIHLTQTLEALHLYLASKLLLFEPSKDMLAFSLIECVMNIFARINAI